VQKSCSEDLISQSYARAVYSRALANA